MNGNAATTVPSPLSSSRRRCSTMTGSQATSGGVAKNHSSSVRRSLSGSAGYVAGRVALQGDRRERRHQVRVGPGEEGREMLGAQPFPEGLGRHVLGPIDEHGHETPVGVVQRQLDRHAVGVAAELPAVAVEERVDVIALFEHAAGRMQRVHLAEGPFVPQRRGNPSSTQYTATYEPRAGVPVMADGSGSRNSFSSAVATKRRPAKL